MKEIRNSLRVTFKQDFVKTVKRGGTEIQVPVKNLVEFTESTKLAVNTANFSDWLIGRLLNYQLIQKLQGAKEKFDTAQQILMEISINDKVAASAIKFSTNPKTLQRNLEQYPTVVSAAFNPASLAFGTSRDEILGIAKGVVKELAPATNPENAMAEIMKDAPELPAEVVTAHDLSTENVEEAEVVE